ncbi:mitochondrial 37S ribosomal protein mS45 MRPS35 [Sporobolomyces salmoneus]|uniref:mitochondrial 37S ribosomal protein mS45 MRPS35 n=1 Tax=Sporobolomyces salmoneus TaxID=183962 RepID=UPI0031793BB5
MFSTLRIGSTAVSGASRAPARAIASTSRALAQPPAEHIEPSKSESVSGSETAGDVAQSGATPEVSSGGSRRGYNAWMNGEGARFRKGIKGRTNWIGESPFPLNPSFNPNPPLADETKTKIYNAYVHNILIKNATDSQVVRAVSSKFGVAMDRVRAIIRLKELEKSWKSEGRTLQTELLKGMESHLGVRQPGENWRGFESPDPIEPTLASKKTVFEMVDVESGDSPVFLPLLSRVPKRATPLTSVPPLSSTSASSLPSTTTTKSRTIPASRPGRAATVFVDLSGTKEGEELQKSYDPRKTKRGLPAKKVNDKVDQ